MLILRVPSQRSILNMPGPWPEFAAADQPPSEPGVSKCSRLRSSACSEGLPEKASTRSISSCRICSASRAPGPSSTAQAPQRRPSDQYAPGAYRHGLDDVDEKRHARLSIKAVPTPTLKQCATTAIATEHTASTLFAMGAMRGRLVAQLKMPRALSASELRPRPRSRQPHCKERPCAWRAGWT